MAFLSVSKVEFNDFLSSVTLSGSPNYLVKASFLLICSYNANYSLSYDAFTKKNPIVFGIVSLTFLTTNLKYASIRALISLTNRLLLFFYGLSILPELLTLLGYY